HMFEAGTYFIALANCGSEAADYTIRAKLLTPPDADTAELTPETSFGAVPAAAPGSCSLGRTQYRVTVPGSGPCGGTLLEVFASSNQNINLYARRNQRVVIEGGQIVADVASTSPGNSKRMTLTTGGAYFIAVSNCSTETANYDLSAGMVVIEDDFTIVNGCHLLRNPTGSYVLEVFGANIK